MKKPLILTIFIILFSIILLWCIYALEIKNRIFFLPNSLYVLDEVSLVDENGTIIENLVISDDDTIKNMDYIRYNDVLDSIKFNVEISHKYGIVSVFDFDKNIKIKSFNLKTEERFLDTESFLQKNKLYIKYVVNEPLESKDLYYNINVQEVGNVIVKLKKKKYETVSFKMHFYFQDTSMWNIFLWWDGIDLSKKSYDRFRDILEIFN